MNTSGFDTFALITLFVMAVAVPLLGIWDFRRLIRWTEEGRPDARIKSFQWILVMEWGLTLALLAGWWFANRELEPLGLVPAYQGWQWLAVGVALIGVVALIWQMNHVLKDPKQLEELRTKMGDLRALAPQTPEENTWFAMVAVTAGICEEILYRGILMAALDPMMGIWPAVAITSVIFGLGHAYQGLTGIVKTTLVGVVMALVTVFSGSLLAAIVLHALIDLTSGRMMGAALQEEPVVST